MKTNLSIFTLLLTFATAVSATQTIKGYIDNEWPESRYSDHGDGTVTDTVTGLMWKQCSEGQSYSGGDCDGDASNYNWELALQQPASVNSGGYAGHSDWRLPNINELASLVARDRYGPSINLERFPSTPAAWFWSSSPFANYSINAWKLSFADGVASSYYRGNSYHVRLVRSGQ